MPPWLFPNWSGWHSIKLGLYLATAGLAGISVAALPPGAPPSIAVWTHYVQGLIGLAGSLVVVLSGTPLGPSTTTKNKRL